MSSDVELRQGASSCAAASWLTAKDIATTGNHQQEGDVSDWFSNLLFCEASFVLLLWKLIFVCHQYYAVSSNPKPKEALCSSTWGVTKKPCFVNSWFWLPFNCVLQLHSLWCIVFACDRYFQWVLHLGEWALWISFANCLQCYSPCPPPPGSSKGLYQFLIWEKSQVL
jgi:hypothetical protein